MTTKHTPGPWFSCKGKRDVSLKIHEIKDSEGLLLAEAIKRADARLIAAAPELLAACDMVVADITNGYGELFPSTLRHLHIAIAKAKGEAP